MSDVSITDNGTITVNGTLSFSSSAVTITGSGGAISTIVNNGTIEIQGFNDVISDVSVTGNGDITIATGKALTLDDVTLSGTVTNGTNSSLYVDTNHTLTLSGATIDGGTVINNGTIDVTAASTIEDVSVQSYSLNVASGATLTLEGSSDTITGVSAGGSIDNSGTIAGAGSIDNSQAPLTVTNEATGVIDANAGGGVTLTLNPGYNVDNAGLIEGTNGGDLVIDDTVSNTGAGAVVADGGTVTVESGGAVAGGTLEITNGGTLDLLNSIDQNVTFVGAGTLEIGLPTSYSANSTAFSGTNDITGLTAGDIIDLATVAPSSIISAFISGTTLTVTESDSSPLSYQIAGSSLSADYFSVQSDSAGGSDLVLSTAPTSHSFTTIDDPSATDTYYGFALGINNASQIVGTYNSSREGFLDTSGTFTTIDDPSGTISYGAGDEANGINNAGQIVGLYFTGYVEHGFIDTGGSFITLDDSLGGSGAFQGTSAQGINNAGQVVGYYTDSSGIEHGFLYSGGTYTTIDDPLGTSTNATGINDAGDIVGFYHDSSGKYDGFIYINGAFTTIDDPLGVEGTTVTSINNEGDIVGSYTDSSGVGHGFLYSGGVYTTVDDPLGASSNADGINDAGQIVGYYNNGSEHDGFLANPEFTINAGATVELNPLYTTADVTFAASTGTLILSDPSTFTGEIAGISGSGDVIDLGSLATADAATSDSPGSYNPVTDTTLLTVTEFVQPRAGHD